MNPVPIEYLVHGLGAAFLGFLTLIAILIESRLAPLLAVVTGLISYWLFLTLPVLIISAAVTSLLVADLGIVSYAARRSGTWRLIIHR